MAADYVNTTFDDIMHAHGVNSYESLQKTRQELPAVPVQKDYVNPTYDEIMHGDEVKPYESLQKQEIRQGFPAVPALVRSVPAGPVPAGPVPAASQPLADAGSTQTEVLLNRYKAAVKRYKAAVIVLCVLSVLLLLAVILVYLFVGQTCNCQAINKQQNITEDQSMTFPEVNYTPTGTAAVTTTLAALTAATRPGTTPISMTTLTTTTTATTTMSQRIPKNCQEYTDSGVTQSGVYPIQIISHPQADAVDVYCDMMTDGGGWTTLMKREDGSVRFPNRSWTGYKHGFGDVSGEHWIGNDFMNELTLNNGDLYELRFDLEAFDGEKRYAKYQHFAVANETANYRLFLGSYSGDAGDSLVWHGNMEFTTIDRDNDGAEANCAIVRFGGWWYNSCVWAKLTGTYGSTDCYEGVNWYKFKGYCESLKYADMKVRPSSVVKNSCKALKKSGVHMTGPQNISMHLNASAPTNILVLCDQVTEGGGWMLILKRIDGETVDFNRNWAEYRAGFGQQNGEFWFGLETLHKITSTVVIYELYIGLKTSSNDIRYIIYTSFKVTAESNDYRLVLGPVEEGDLVDSLRGNNGQPFSTRDTDNDNWEQDCAQTNAAGWWYNSCTEALLTGRDDPGVPVQQRLRWKNWLGTGEEFPPIAEATMMIRPVN